MQTSCYDILAQHCGAVLLCQKPAALFSLPDEDALLGAIATVVEEHRLRLLVMRQKGRPRRVLLFVYHAGLLEEALAHPVAHRALARLGYPVDSGLPALLAHMQGRLLQGAQFPHEIGFFLGYPPADVVGFMHHGGRGCKHSCMWKVYSDVGRAKRLCDHYRQCSALCRQQFLEGGALAPPQPALKTVG